MGDAIELVNARDAFDKLRSSTWALIGELGLLSPEGHLVSEDVSRRLRALRRQVRVEVERYLESHSAYAAHILEVESGISYPPTAARRVPV